MLYIIVGTAIGVVLALTLGRRTARLPIREIVETKGFARSDETVTVTLEDGTEIKTTAGEFSKRVLKVDGRNFWLRKRFDIIIGAIYCGLGVIAGVLASHWFP